MQPTYTSDEERTARIILQHTDKDSLTVLTRESAQLLQPLVHLPTNILSKIWDIVDQDETGFLTSDQIPRFVRLIGYAQTNEALTRTLLQKPGPECRIDGWTHPKDKEWVQHSNEEELELLVAIMRENDKDNYGMLDATTAKAVLGRSGLPNEILGEIWDLVDDPPKGFLVIHDMRKALRLISCAQRGMKLHRRLYEHRM
jgi:epidermal growth factor receptor substrate 15